MRRRRTVRVKRREATHSMIKTSILKHQMKKRTKMRDIRGM
jgi:hypothetical protein